MLSRSAGTAPNPMPAKAPESHAGASDPRLQAFPLGTP